MESRKGIEKRKRDAEYFAKQMQETYPDVRHIKEFIKWMHMKRAPGYIQHPNRPILVTDALIEHYADFIKANPKCTVRALIKSCNQKCAEIIKKHYVKITKEQYRSLITSLLNLSEHVSMANGY